MAIPTSVLGAMALDREPNRILFFGNGLTYYNDLPLMLEQLAASTAAPLTAISGNRTMTNRV